MKYKVFFEVILEIDADNEQVAKKEAFDNLELFLMHGAPINELEDIEINIQEQAEVIK